MIPKTIHYCWFGRNPLPELAEKCIASWRKFCPDYEIKEWNESNFNMDCCDYVREAYAAKKWAFVSDYARFWILYHEGGLYFDTDVEIIKSITDIVEKGSFMGCEPGSYQFVSGSNKKKWKRGVDTTAPSNVNCAPGLGLGVNPGHGLYKEILDFYQKKYFLKPDGTPDVTTVVDYTTDVLLKHEWKSNGSIQTVAGVTIYPPEYFCPLNYDTGVLTITENTRSIHHYTASWQSESDKKYYQWTLVLQNRFGYKIGKRFGRILDFPHRVHKKLCAHGLKETIKFTLEKLFH